MKVIATNIFDFTTWYKFGYKTVPASLIIDLSAPALTGEELLAKTGYFEEEYEVFYLEVKETAFYNNDGLRHLSLYDIDFIIPVSEMGARLLQSKIPDFRLSEPLDQHLYQKLLMARNDFLAVQGATNLLSSFGISGGREYEKLQESFLQSLMKYKADLNARQDTATDYLLFYERSKPFPLNDQGFLFDVGSIARVWFGLTDDDLKNKEALNEKEPAKYELVNQVLGFSNFLKTKEIDGVWTSFLNYYNENRSLQKFNEKIRLPGIEAGINNLLAIAFYLKFRDRIRNTRALEDKAFADEVNYYLTRFRAETTIALLLNGLFFGGLKFRELHYKYAPLNIAKYTLKKAGEAKVPVAEVLTPNNKVQEPAIEEKLVPENREPEKELTAVSTGVESQTNDHTESNFEKYWQLLNPVTKKCHKDQQAAIKKLFKKICEDKQDRLIQEPKEQLFVNELKRQITDKRIKKESSRLTKEIVDEIAECIYLQVN